MAEPERQQTLRQWANRDVTQEPLCINYPDANFELKSGLIHLLPSFRGLEKENPHKFLMEFHVVCVGMKPQTVTEDAIKLRAFPFTLLDSAKEWLYELPPGSITTWADMMRAFLDKYFPEQMASNLRRDIIGIKQKKREAFHTYWERFKKLCSRCPNHGISEYQLSQYFCEGMSPMDRRLLSASSGGSICDKTPNEIWGLVKNFAEDSKHSGNDDEWYEDTPRDAKPTTSPIEAQISKLTEAVLLLTKDKVAGPSQKSCGLCYEEGHFNDQCPLIAQELGEASYMGHPPNQNPNPRPYDQNRNNYPPRQQGGWGQPKQQPPPPQKNSEMNLQDIVMSLASSTQVLQQETRAFQQETKSSIKNLEQQMAQLASSVSKLESQGKLPAQTEKNPKHNVFAVTLKSEEEDEEEVDEEIIVEEKTEEVEKTEPTEDEKPTPIKTEMNFKPPPPFPSRLRSTKREREEEEVMETFHAVEVNFPLLNAIKQVPRYVKLLTEFCTSKKKLKGNETIEVGENTSAVLQKRLPPKCKDPGVFTVPCKLGNLTIQKAMLDLGASINVLPYSIFKTLNVGLLKNTKINIQLADRSVVHPIGVLEDILVQVNDLIFPADFYVLDMGDDDTLNSSSILLGRPFLKTAKTKIDVYNGTLSMEFDGDVINFNICNTTPNPADVPSLNFLDVIKPQTEECFELSNPHLQALVSNRNLEDEVETELTEKFKLGEASKTFPTFKKTRKKARYKTRNFELHDTDPNFFPSDVQVPNMKRKSYYEGSGVKNKEVEKMESPTFKN